MKGIKQKFFDITDLIQAEFDRNMDIYSDKIQCRRGCSKCCSQIFRITALDGWIIAQHVKSLPEPRRRELQQKAREYLSHLPDSKGDNELSSDESAMNVTNSNHPGSSSHPSLKKEGSNSASDGTAEFHGLPCPALGAEGECTIYEARPVICRRFGMPIYDYKNPSNVHACELNFKDGDEITDVLLVLNQTAIGKKWDELKAEFGEGATTIAEAIAQLPFDSAKGDM